MLRPRLSKAAALPLLALTLVSLGSSAANAKGLILITSGQTIKNVGEPADEMKPVIHSITGTPTNYHVGYMHESIGIYWIDLWTWGGQYVLYDDTEEDVWTLDPEQTATILGTTSNGLSKPVFYTFPPGLLALVGIGAVWLGFESKSRKIRHSEELAVEPLTSSSLAVE